MKIIITILILLFSVTTVTASDLFNQDKMVGDIAKSIREHPEQWIDTGSRFVHCEDPDEMKRLKERLYPELDSNLVIIYNFYRSSSYTLLDKPFKYTFRDESLKELVQEIKLYKLRVLQKDVGHLLNRKKVPEKKVEKKEIIKEGDMRKL